MWVAAGCPSSATHPRRSARLAAVTVGQCSGMSSHSASATLQLLAHAPAALLSANAAALTVLQRISGTTTEAVTACLVS
jgi:hypothetical protein